MYQPLEKRSVCGDPMTRSKPSLRITEVLWRLIAIDPWGNGTSIPIAKGTDLQDPELVHGLQPKTVAAECLRLSHPRITQDGWTKEAVKDYSTRWQTIRAPEGKDLWLKMDTGQTQYTLHHLCQKSRMRLQYQLWNL